jgi:hypothetical protein
MISRKKLGFEANCGVIVILMIAFFTSCKTRVEGEIDEDIPRAVTEKLKAERMRVKTRDIIKDD